LDGALIAWNKPPLGGKLIKFIFKIGIRFYARWCEQEIKKNFVLICLSICFNFCPLEGTNPALVGSSLRSEKF